MLQIINLFYLSLSAAWASRPSPPRTQPMEKVDLSTEVRCWRSGSEWGWLCRLVVTFSCISRSSWATGSSCCHHARLPCHNILDILLTEPQAAELCCSLTERNDFAVISSFGPKKRRYINKINSFYPREQYVELHYTKMNTYKGLKYVNIYSTHYYYYNLYLTMQKKKLRKKLKRLKMYISRACF